MPERDYFPLPAVIDPPKTRCICIPVPDDVTYVRIVVGLIHELTQWFNWERNEGHDGKEAAQVWKRVFNEIDWSTMSCCCTDEFAPPSGFFRVNSNGQMETSSDGGVTWTVNTTQDYRYSSGQFPPLPADVLGDDPRCQSANNVLAYLQSAQEKYNDAWTLNGDIGALVTAVLALIQEVGILAGISSLTIAAAGFPYLLVLGVAVAAYYLGRSVWDASFSDEFWQEVLCAIYCNIGEDGSISAGQFAVVLSKINDIGFSAARLYIWAFVNAIGAVGLQNAARTMSSSEESCEDCEPCQTPCGEPFISYYGVGTIVGSGDDYIEMESEVWSGTGAQSVALSTFGTMDCCHVDHIETVSGAWTNVAYAACGETVPAEGAGFPHNGLTVACSVALNTILIYSTAGAFRVKIFLRADDCP